jgi:hypothetical protein
MESKELVVFTRQEIFEIYGLMLGMLRAEADHLNQLRKNYYCEPDLSGGAKKWYWHCLNQYPSIQRAKKIYDEKLEEIHNAYGREQT